MFNHVNVIFTYFYRETFSNRACEFWRETPCVRYFIWCKPCADHLSLWHKRVTFIYCFWTKDSITFLYFYIFVFFLSNIFNHCSLNVYAYTVSVVWKESPLAFFHTIQILWWSLRNSTSVETELWPDID